MFKFNFRTLFIWLLILFFGLPLLISLIQPKSNGHEISLTRTLNDIKAGSIQKIEVEGEQLFITYKDGKEESARKEAGIGLTEILQNAGIDPASIDVQVRDSSLSRVWSEILLSLLPILGMGLLLLFLFRQARGQQESIFSFGRSRAKLFSKGKQDVKFTDVAGVDEAKKELEELVDFLKNPKKYRAVGARTPKGVLLFGPSGVGKTLLAKAIAGEANVPFFSMAGSEFMEMLVGIGASRVRDLFSTAKKNSPSIIFIDEIDAIGRQRGSGVASGGHDEREQTLNQILVEMDGFTPNDAVIVLAATNRSDMLDPALLRPGRFDRRVMLDYPDVEGRKAILQIHAKGKPFDKDLDWDKAAKRTVGFSGADLENMLNEAAILAARDDRQNITMKDLEEAATKVKLGPEKRRLQSDLEKKMTAYHEAGHAIVGFYMPQLDPVHRVSIVSRGLALGFTMMRPQADKYQQTASELKEQIAMMLGGRAAEDLIFGELTGGAANDLEKATKVARNMVIRFGMSSLGPGYWGPEMDVTDMGKLTWYDKPQLSNELQFRVDEEIQKILDGSYKRAAKILKDKKDKLDLIAQKLVEVENLEGEEFEKIIGEERPKYKTKPEK
jgi:cell division protease FtsH